MVYPQWDKEDSSIAPLNIGKCITGGSTKALGKPSFLEAQSIGKTYTDHRKYNFSRNFKAFGKSIPDNGECDFPGALKRLENSAPDNGKCDSSRSFKALQKLTLANEKSNVSPHYKMLVLGKLCFSHRF